MANLILKAIKNPCKVIAYFGGRGHLKWIPDKIYLKMCYYAVFEKRLNLVHPETFNEKMQWLKLYDRNPEYTRMVDKYEAKKYIGEKIGEQYTIPTLGVWEQFEEINFDELPRQFVLKCTHDSGGIVICPNKDELDKAMARQKIKRAMAKNFYYDWREFPYKNVQPRIIAEKYMENQQKGELIDYKVMCFNGKAKCIFTCSERFSCAGLRVTFYDLNWNRLPFERHYPSSKNEMDKPKNFDAMIIIAEKLSEKCPFLRVDFYEVNSQLYIGELTLYPGSGLEEFSPETYDTLLGSYIKLPN